MIAWLGPESPFPPVDRALRNPNGLLAAGADLSVPRLLDAYRHGIFPWFSGDEPILWWSPDPRMVLIPAELKVSRSLAKVLRNRPWEIRWDHDFRSVIRHCAGPRAGQPGTWITKAMQDAYHALHRAGHAHCVETWIEGELAGGLYGVAIGGMFYGESMFSLRPDASKIALVHLARQLQSRGFGMIDCQMSTPHLASMGAREISRTRFLQRLAELLNYPGWPGKWHVNHGPAE